jgi:hypothetical protein
VGSLAGPSISGLAMMNLGNRWLFYLPSILTAAFVLEIVMLNAMRPLRVSDD